MEITNEIQDLIKKQLPGVHADALKEFIEEAQKLKEKDKKRDEFVVKLREELEFETNLRKEAQNKNAKAGDILSRENALEIKEKELTYNLKLFELDKKYAELVVKEAEKRADSIYTLTGILFKNTETMKMITDSKNLSYSNQYNNSSYENKLSGEYKSSIETEKIDKGDVQKPGTI